MAATINSVPDTQLGLTNDEIALLRHHQQAVASAAGGSSSRAASRASSQGLLLLDGTSLLALSRHFDRLIQQIQARLDYLSEQSQMIAQHQYDRAGNPLPIADSEITRFHDILRQIDELETTSGGGGAQLEPGIASSRQRHRHLRGVQSNHRSASSRDRDQNQRAPGGTNQNRNNMENATQPVPRSSAVNPLSTVKAEQKMPSEKTLQFQGIDSTQDVLEGLASLNEQKESEYGYQFYCVFDFAGCQSTFASMNEWKHHVISQHLNLYSWVCELCILSRAQGETSQKAIHILDGNEFYSNDAFIYHLRRMHAPHFPAGQKNDENVEWEEKIKKLQISCLKGKRKPPTIPSCPECGGVFKRVSFLEELMEHAVVHTNRGNVFTVLGKPQGKWRNYHPFVEWAMREKIIEKEAGGGFRLCDGEATKRDFGEEGNVLENRKTLRTGPGGDSRCDSMGFTQGLSNNDREDTQKVYTDNQKLDIEDEVKEKLASTFSFEMVQNFHEIWGKWDGKIPTANAVADLLKEFSIKLHSVAKPGQQKDASVFVRHYRHRIAKKFETCVNVLSQPEECTLVDEVEQGNKHQPQKHAGLGLSLLEKMQLWDDTKSEAATDQKTHPSCLEEEYEEDYAITHSPEVWEFLTKSPAYKWLIEKMKSGALLIEIGGTLMERIGNEITRGLSTVASDHGYNNGVCNGFFEITWDLPAFIGHEYAQESNLQLGSIITITGSSTDAQALSCAEYMRQVWPTTGTETLKALQDALDKGLGKPHKCCTADKTHITTELHESSICVIVQGTSPAVVEIGQQLAWLGATLRSSISSERMSFSQPIITTVIDKKANFKLSFQVEEISPDGTNFQSTGACWRPLFRNPVIVKGFPILTRHYEEKGLEVPLNMMAGLGQACRATYFAGGLLIKGFSTLFCPSQLIKNSVQWHYLFEKDASRISYLAADSNCPNRLKLLDLDTTRLARCRNFLGWASSVEIHAGTKGSKYSDIDWPGSSLATPGIAFEKASIIAGSYLSGGASFTRGNKDTPIYIHRGGPYPQEIHSAQNMKVVLYDTRDRVGWLVDGASALLHITRTQLGSSPYSDSEHLRIEDFQHADPKGGPLAAKTALMDQNNRSLIIFEEVETSIESRAGVGEGAKAEVKTLTSRWTYQDLVRQTYHILEQLHDYETKILTSPAIGLRFTGRDKLTGFAFMDIVDVQNDLRPRVATLKSSGRGWVDFTRGIRAITLLGKGFGEIIRPSTDANQLCKNWKHVPTGKDYLVASTSTLKGICRRYGNQDSKPIELANGIHWHKPDKLFEPCECRSGKTCDRVQVLLPASLGTKKNPQPFGCEKGAVIFGRSMRFPWHWPCKGQPVEGGSSDSEHDDSDFHDSGLGSNLSQSVTIPSPSSSSDTPQV